MGVIADNMRNKVYFINQRSTNLDLNDNWYVFYYISVIDIITFLLDKNEEIRISIDIDNTNVLKPSKFILKKRIKRKLINYGNNYYFSLNKDSCKEKIAKTVGTTLIFSENTLLTSISENDLFNKIKGKEITRDLGFDYFFSVHDFDWETIAYFRCKELADEFIAYINQNANLVSTSNLEQFE